MTKAEFMEMMDWAKEQTTSDIVKALRETEYRGYMKAIADRPQGEWIITESHRKGQIIYYDYKCSICGHHRDRRMNYCEVCGARMKGVDND